MKTPSHPAARALLALAILFIAAGSRLDAFVRRHTPEGPAYRVDFNYTPILRYHLGSPGSVRGVVSNEWNSVRAAFAQWQSIPGTNIRFSEGPVSPALGAIPEEDGRVDVHWVSPGLHSVPALGGTLSLQAGQIASAWIVDDGTGVILQSVILINRDLDYLTDYEASSATRPYLESVVLHEIGHILGLNHAVLGGATLWWFQGGGVGTAAGLSSDEVAFALAEYGSPAARAARATLRGSVRMGAAPVLGALVSVEGSDGRTLSATVTRANGAFELPGLDPGVVRVAVRALDPDSPSDAYLIRGREIDVSAAGEYLGSATGFLPPAAVERTLSAGGTSVLDLQVAAGSPVWRVVEIRSGIDAAGRSSSDAGLVLDEGVAGASVGVFVSGPVPADARLAVSGPGLSTGPTQVIPNALRQLTLVQAPVTVANGASAGLRTIEVTAGGSVARAPGFVEIRARAPDDNHDGLDDRFQRRYFAPFTRTEAGPSQDPDGDGWVNRREAAGGSNPLDPASIGLVLSDLRVLATEVRVRLETAPGRRYELLVSQDVAGTPVRLGDVFTATGEGTDVIRQRPAGGSAMFRARQVP